MALENSTQLNQSNSGNVDIHSFLVPIDDKEDVVQLLVTLQSKRQIDSSSIESLKGQGYLHEISQQDYFNSSRVQRKIEELQSEIVKQQQQIDEAQKFLDSENNKRYFLGGFGKWISGLFEPEYEKRLRKDQLDNAEYLINHGNEKLAPLKTEQEAQKKHPNYSDAIIISGRYLYITDSAKNLIEIKENREAFLELASNFQAHIESNEYDQLVELLNDDIAEELKVAVIKAIGARNSQAATDTLVELFSATSVESEEQLILQLLEHQDRIGGTRALTDCIEYIDDLTELPRSLVMILLAKIEEGSHVQSALISYYVAVSEDATAESITIRKLIASAIASQNTYGAKDTLVELFETETESEVDDYIIGLMQEFIEPQATEGLKKLYDEYTDYDVPICLIEALAKRLNDEEVRELIIDFYENTEEDSMRALLVTKTKLDDTVEATDMLGSFLESDINNELDFPDGLVKTLFERRNQSDITEILAQQFEYFSLDEMKELADMCIREATQETQELFVACILNIDDEKELLEYICTIKSDASTDLLVAIATDMYEANDIPDYLKNELVSRMGPDKAQQVLQANSE